MAEICCENEAPSPQETGSAAARRRRMEIRRFKYVSDSDKELKRLKPLVYPGSLSRDCENAYENCAWEEEEAAAERSGVERDSGVLSEMKALVPIQPSILNPSLSADVGDSEVFLKYGMTSVCGRRREMEDAVAIHPLFCRQEHESPNGLHYVGVYDGHGCSHVAMKCRDRLHELVKEELHNGKASTEWRNAMNRSFSRMDKEVIAWNEDAQGASCRCELQTPDCDAVGSTAVVAILTPEKIIVANCGDSRAVLCRNGKAVPLSTDHKPDRPDELSRIEDAGGRVIYWDGPRVLGVLAMSRAIGDNYLKPFVSCEPEVTITDRTAGDDCLILASDGLWDVVSNDTACDLARMCLEGKKTPHLGKTARAPRSPAGGEKVDKACSDASMLLTKLALSRCSADNVSVVVINLKKGHVETY